MIKLSYNKEWCRAIENWYSSLFFSECVGQAKFRASGSYKSVLYLDPENFSKFERWKEEVPKVHQLL